MAASKKHESLRGDQPEREGQEDIRQRQIAEAVAGPDLRADGSGEENSHASTVNAQLAEGDKAADQPMLDVGDTVSPVDREANTTVVAVLGESAGEHHVEEIDETVAEYFDCNPDEDVYKVVFPDRTTKDIDALQRYPYPRSQLEVEHHIHDRDDGEGGEA